MTSRGAVLLLTLLLAWTPVRAEPICGMLNALEAADVASPDDLAAAPPAEAEGRIAALDQALRRLAEHHFAALETDKGTAEGATGDDGSLDAFIESRRDLIETYRRRGARAAAGLMAGARYRAEGAALRRMTRRGGCAPSETAGEERDGAPPPGEGEAARGGASRTRDARSVGRARAMPEAPSDRFGLYVAIVSSLVAAAAVVSIAMRPEQRRDKRYLCDIPTRLRIGDEALPAVVTNISRGGAQLRVEKSFEAGRRGAIDLAGERRDVKVAWSNQHYLGVQFARRLKFSPKRLISRS